jgi:MFS family permease
MPASTGPLHAPNFRLLFASRAISYFGTSLAPIAVAFAVLDLTGSASDTGIAFACWTLAQISTLLVEGVVADRLPRRLVMVSSEAANFLVRATMGVLLISEHARIWEIFVLQAIGGAATAFYSPASSGLVPEAIWIVVTTAIVVSVRDVRDFRLRPSLREPDLAASVPAS